MKKPVTNHLLHLHTHTNMHTYVHAYTNVQKQMQFIKGKAHQKDE